MQGIKGDTGATGLQGERGLTGMTGPKGDTGTTGPQGLQGETGPQGPQGERGLQGLTGPKGDKGDPGATGPAGPQGETGLTGAIGPKGEQGERGPEGPQGIPGPQGPQGPVGPSGASNAWAITGATNTIPGTNPGQNYLGTADSTPLVIATSATAAMIVDEFGRVSITGQTGSPALTVNGYIKVAPEGILFPDGTVQRTAYKKKPRKNVSPYPWESAGSASLPEKDAVSDASTAPSVEELESHVLRMEAELQTLKQHLQDKKN